MKYQRLSKIHAVFSFAILALISELRGRAFAMEAPSILLEPSPDAEKFLSPQLAIDAPVS